MPWYKTGTVSVTQNSNAIIGTGTAFIANSRVGDAFRGPDGGWYEITNIASDTAMAIDPPYQGATNASGVYALAPMQGYIKDSADALRALVNQFGGILAVLGEDPTVTGVRSALNISDTDGIPPGQINRYLTNAGVIGSILTGLNPSATGAVESTDTIVSAFSKLKNSVAAVQVSVSDVEDSVAAVQNQKATKGANNDITSLSGLTTALSLAQGGTGVTSMALLVSALQAAGVFGKTNVLGSVSQVGGVPAGAIIERGSNSNGEFVKFADGTLICTFAYDASAMAITSAVGSIYQAGQEITWTYPATFIGVPIPCPNVYRNDGTVIIGIFTRIVTSTTMQWRLWSATAFAGGNVKNVTLFAIGRWF